MVNFKFGKDALVVASLTLITVSIWIGFDIYRALTKTTIPRVLQRQITPLNPKLDQETIDQLRSRRVFSQADLDTVPIPEATEEGEAEETIEQPEEIVQNEEGTESGSLE